MYKIDSVRVEGFWGRYVAETQFHEDVNVFIGRNGSGKTTFMDLLQGVLRADLRILASHQFSSIVIRLSENGRHRTIKVAREVNEKTVDHFRFQVGRRAFRFPVYSPETDPVRHYRVRPHLSTEYDALRDEIASTVKVASLSVHRAAFEQVIEEEYPGRRRPQRPPIDWRLEELLKNLTSFQLALAQQAAAVSAQFQKDVLASILFDKRYDTFSWSVKASVDLAQHQEQLTRAYQELGALSKSVSDQIIQHVTAIHRSLSAVREYNEKKEESKGISIDAILPLPLLRRSEHIVELMSETEKQKREVSRPIREFVRTLKEFIQDKTIEITPRGELVVERDNKRIAVAQMSSGEKQLFILLIETLLQRNEPFVFLADEPELSLHIEWQEKVIGSIKRLNQSAQVVVATHSPEIAAGWRDRIIDMAEVVRG